MHEELGAVAVKQTEDGVLCGVAVSPGRYTGPVRVIRTEAELSQLRAGEVLVCPTTHSSWAVAFSQVGALVADGGSRRKHRPRRAAVTAGQSPCGAQLTR